MTTMQAAARVAAAAPAPAKQSQRAAVPHEVGGCGGFGKGNFRWVAGWAAGLVGCRVAGRLGQETVADGGLQHAVWLMGWCLGCITSTADVGWTWLCYHCADTCPPPHHPASHPRTQPPTHLPTCSELFKSFESYETDLGIN